MIGRGRPRGDECLAPSPERSEVTRPGRRVLAGEVGEPIEVGVEVRPIRVDDVIRPERGHHATGPAAAAQPGVSLQRRRSRRRSWPGTRSRTARRGRGGGRRPRRAGRRGGRRSRRHCRPPAASRPRRPPRACGPATASRACPGRGGCSRRRCARRSDRRTRRASRRGRDTQRLEGDALAVEHPQQVVVPGDQLGGGVADRGVVGEGRRVAVPVGADERERTLSAHTAHGRWSAHRGQQGEGGWGRAGMQRFAEFGLEGNPRAGISVRRARRRSGRSCRPRTAGRSRS